MMNVKQAWPLLKQTYTEWDEDKVTRLAAALAYYTILSLAPLLVVAVAVAGLAFGEDAAKGQIAAQIQGLVGPAAGQAIQGILANAKAPSEGIISSILGIIVLLFGASGVFTELQDALDTIWGVTPKPGRGIVGAIKDRFFSFTMVLSVAFMLLVSLVLSAGLAAAGKWFSHLLPLAPWLWQAVNQVVSFVVIAGLFGLIYKVIPDAKVTWHDVRIGAAFTALLFVIGKFALGMYLGRSSVSSPYGAAGSLIVVITWVYYSAQILFFGAEFTQVYARATGKAIEPTLNAVPLTDEARARQGMPREEQKQQAAENAQAQSTGAKQPTHS